MLKHFWQLVLLCFAFHAGAQQLPFKISKKETVKDTLLLGNIQQAWEYDLPVIALHEDDKNESSAPIFPSLLTASRDVFQIAASFHFGITRFRPRGYETSTNTVLINGITMNSTENGSISWVNWGGLNDATRNTQTIMGLRPYEQAIGNIGNTISIDTRASHQRAQTKASYTFSNRSFTHRWMISHVGNLSARGWAYAFNGSWRNAAEGYFPGTGYQSGSFFAAVDKQLSAAHLLSINVFGVLATTDKQSPILEESAQLAGTYQYNAYWGYQSGKKRNANIGKTFQPFIILTHEFRISNQSFWISSISFQAGEKSSTGLDWYKAADPRPDYYRYLPSWQKDSLLNFSVRENSTQNKELMQINWDAFYNVNRNSLETVLDANGIPGNAITGLRSHYIQEERVSAVKRLDLVSSYHTQWHSDLSFSCGFSLQLQQTHNFKRVADLLGGAFYVDWNQFAERDFPNDGNAIQNDLKRPNRILIKGDHFGYDYGIQTQIYKSWTQLSVNLKKVDLFSSLGLTNTRFFRKGYVVNGLFPDNSFGKSTEFSFLDYFFKSGITYKINGRKYLYLHTALLTKAPSFDDFFISPRSRDHFQENSQTESIQTVEAGYVLNTPAFRIRGTGYFTSFSNGMDVITFYHDGYRNFMNYALSGIGKIHFGVEGGGELKINSRFTLSAAAAIGRYFYNSRQKAMVSADNDAFVAERALIYTKNFRVPGTPQEAYHLGLGYQAGAWYGNVSGNYFRENWLAFNPMRRTYDVLQGITPGSEKWQTIISQVKLPEQFAMDLLVGTSLPIALSGKSNKGTLLITISINNLLNNQQIIAGGYEQLRFDTDEKDPGKFPPKYFYAMGLNFSVNIGIRF